MVKSKKYFFLFLALLLPVVLFVFLKYFGENEFSIPIYYEHSTLGRESLCHESISLPYAVPSESPVPIRGVSVLSFHDPNEQTLVQLNRVKNSFEGQVQVKSIIWGKDPFMDDQIILDSLTYAIAKCQFLITHDSTTVLIDNERRIRGYYDGQSMKDMDRLIMEVKILLEKY
ncbi:MAG: hypothetical protein HC811_11650 [Flammeovirgaceae bacterium]|nr:hypothetical protein [Flammeovirgaceae bacterium]